MEETMKLDELTITCRSELIAQQPSETRDGCRLMVLDRQTNTVEHRHFYDILDYLGPTDCLVVNNSKVLPARLFGTKAETGGRRSFF